MTAPWSTRRSRAQARTDARCLLFGEPSSAWRWTCVVRRGHRINLRGAR